MKKILLTLYTGICCFALPAQDTDPITQPHKIAIDSKENIYVIDAYGTMKISSDGKTIQRFPKSQAKFIVIDSKDNIYLAGSNSISKLQVGPNGDARLEHFAGDANKNSGYADGKLSGAKFYDIKGLAIDKNDDLYIADGAVSIIKSLGDKSGKFKAEPNVPSGKKQIGNWSFVRKIENGKLSSIKNNEHQYILLMNVAGFALDSNDNIIFSGGGFSRAIRQLNLTNFSITTLAGKPYKRASCPVYTVGDLSVAELFDPGFILYNHLGDILYSDNRSHRISKISKGKLSTVAGNNIIDPCAQNIGGRAQEDHKDGKASTALFNFPKGMAYDSKGNLYVADSYNNVIRKITPQGMVSSFTAFDRARARINTY